MSQKDYDELPTQIDQLIESGQLPTAPKQPIEDEIAQIEAKQLQQAAEEATESVFIEDWGTFYRRDGGWKGPGGFYGDSTVMGKKCNVALEAQQESK